MQTTLKPWPADALMIVCSPASEANVANMESVHPCECRDCGAALVYDGWTMKRMKRQFVNDPRQIKFFCIPCAVTYDRHSITHFEDHRGHG